jgi:hypothetical protein
MLHYLLSCALRVSVFSVHFLGERLQTPGIHSRAQCFHHFSSFELIAALLPTQYLYERNPGMLGLDRQKSGKTVVRVRFSTPLFVTGRRLHLIVRRVAPHLPPRRRSYCSSRPSSSSEISNSRVDARCARWANETPRLLQRFAANRTARRPRREVTVSNRGIFIGLSWVRTSIE